MEKHQCPVCKKLLKCKIPKGGDGSVVIFPRHKIAGETISAGGIKITLKEATVCPG